MNFFEKTQSITNKKLARLDKECVKVALKEIKLLIKRRAKDGYRDARYYIDIEEWEQDRFTQESVDKIISIIKDDWGFLARSDSYTRNCTKYVIHIDW